MFFIICCLEKDPSTFFCSVLFNCLGPLNCHHQMFCFVQRYSVCCQRGLKREREKIFTFKKEIKEFRHFYLLKKILKTNQLSKKVDLIELQLQSINLLEEYISKVYMCSEFGTKHMPVQLLVGFNTKWQKLK